VNVQPGQQAFSQGITPSAPRGQFTPLTQSKLSQGSNPVNQKQAAQMNGATQLPNQAALKEAEQGMGEITKTLLWGSTVEKTGESEEAALTTLQTIKQGDDRFKQAATTANHSFAEVLKIAVQGAGDPNQAAKHRPKLQGIQTELRKELVYLNKVIEHLGTAPGATGRSKEAVQQLKDQILNTLDLAATDPKDLYKRKAKSREALADLEEKLMEGSEADAVGWAEAAEKDLEDVDVNEFAGGLHVMDDEDQVFLGRTPDQQKEVNTGLFGKPAGKAGSAAKQVENLKKKGQAQFEAGVRSGDVDKMREGLDLMHRAQSLNNQILKRAVEFAESDEGKDWNEGLQTQIETTQEDIAAAKVKIDDAKADVESLRAAEAKLVEIQQEVESLTKDVQRENAELVKPLNDRLIELDSQIAQQQDVVQSRVNVLTKTQEQQKAHERVAARIANLEESREQLGAQLMHASDGAESDRISAELERVNGTLSAAKEKLERFPDQSALIAQQEALVEVASDKLEELNEERSQVEVEIQQTIDQQLGSEDQQTLNDLRDELGVSEELVASLRAQAKPAQVEAHERFMEQVAIIEQEVPSVVPGEPGSKLGISKADLLDKQALGRIRKSLFENIQKNVNENALLTNPKDQQAYQAQIDALAKVVAALDNLIDLAESAPAVENPMLLAEAKISIDTAKLEDLQLKSSNFKETRRLIDEDKWAPQQGSLLATQVDQQNAISIAIQDPSKILAEVKGDFGDFASKFHEALGEMQDAVQNGDWSKVSEKKGGLEELIEGQEKKTGLSDEQQKALASMKKGLHDFLDSPADPGEGDETIAERILLYGQLGAIQVDLDSE
jgi:hypothetical protein